ncbi:uncharacterized protein EV420DRAFT_1734549 [Desarmillaria tabescens]|uniref:F-box domain-containing protein n=1 Tax=Armillaria tabescens TaxID=1929756 RepID=A0AA39NB32_ARMTA|nr:uncharacterized protein EV420DRAFT_1734549 [Desarmillaria tabescens]KAK0462351.1 hypothetical protein EV420DRAFT_1734549 [Desarmillaria tabescens]
MAGIPLNWSPCTGCTCPNHHITSYDFSPDRYILKDPNLARLAGSNDQPLEGEVITLQAMIASYKADIRDIDTEASRLVQFIAEMRGRISLVEQKVDALCQERQSISDAIIEREKILNPVRRLPAEILVRIFHSTIDFPVSRSYNVDDHQWHFHPGENTLWEIEKVCREWKTVALSFPELWSSINIVINDDNFGDHSHGNAYIRWLGRQLDRSKNYPLALSVWNDDDDSTFTKLPPALTAILYSFSTHVECLHLYLTSKIFSAMPLLHLSLPSLKSVCLFPTDIQVMDGYENLDLFLCPVLRRLHIVEVQRVSHCFRLPWMQITHFRSEYGDLLHASQPVLHDMRKLTHIEECHLVLEAESSEGENDLPVKQVADRLKLPALEKLQIARFPNDRPRESDETFTAVCGLLERSRSPHITTLHFDHGCTLEEDLLQILRTCLTLEDVRLTDVDEGAITDEILLQLTLRVDGTTPLVPRLHTLHISGPMTFNMQTFVDMVESRWTLAHAQSPPVQRLDEVNLCRFLETEDEPDEDEVERITILSALDVEAAATKLSITTVDVDVRVTLPIVTPLLIDDMTLISQVLPTLSPSTLLPVQSPSTVNLDPSPPAPSLPNLVLDQGPPSTSTRGLPKSQGLQVWKDHLAARVREKDLAEKGKTWDPKGSDQSNYESLRLHLPTKGESVAAHQERMAANEGSL